MSGPLAGIRVLDLSSVIMGPMATQVLGDQGADVIAVEPGRGELNRSMGPGPHRQLSDISLNLLRNKRNVALDVKHPLGREATLAIAATCDVVVTNLRPVPLARLGLADPDVRAVRPDVVFCQAHGYPSDSPRAAEPAYDDVIQAASGAPQMLVRAGLEPRLVPTLLADKVCGLVIAQAVTAALLHRERTGEGQHVEVPMADVTTAFLLVEHSAGATSTDRQAHVGYERVLDPTRRPQRTLDGQVLVFPYLQHHWDAVLAEGGRGDLVGDPRMSRSGRHDDPDFAAATLDAIVGARTTAAWLVWCRGAGVPVAEVPDLDQVAAGLPMAEHPVAGPYRSIPPPVRFGATPAEVRRPAPLIGEHNHEVLAEVGYSDERIAELEAAGVLRTRGAADSLRAQGRTT